jgi:predicted acylesterase/phospholipase RssA
MTRPTRSSHRPKIGLALAGGGPLGAIYEIGALAAMADCLPGLDLNDLEVYVGVSAGSLVAAGLANGFTPHQMSRVFIEGESTVHPFDPEELLRPAVAEFRQRLKQLPPLAWAALAAYLRRPNSLWRALEKFGRAIPTGLLSGDEIDAFLRRVFEQPGCTNDFRELRHKLFIVATELDTGAAIEFGAKGTDHVPISRAVQASAALPGLFPPVRIDSGYYVDGALKKTLHASVALDQGVELLLCVNPLVPYDATPQSRAWAREYRLDNLVDGGLPIVLSQTFRSIIHSRLDAGMERYRSAYPHADVLLLQPQRTDAAMFFTNMFSYSGRRRLCEHAYQRTREELLARRRRLQPMLARHGIRLDLAALSDRTATLVPHAEDPTPPLLDLNMAATARQLSHALEDLARWVHAQR